MLNSKNAFNFCHLIWVTQGACGTFHSFLKPLSHMHDLGQLTHCNLGNFQILSGGRSWPFVNFMVVLMIGASMVVRARVQKSAKIFELLKIFRGPAQAKSHSAAIVDVARPRQTLSRDCVISQWLLWCCMQKKILHDLQLIPRSLCKCLTISGQC